MANLTSDERDKIITVIHATGGKVSLAATRLKMSRTTLYSYAKQYATIQNAIDEARDTFDDELLDYAEAKLKQAVLDGEQWAIKYALDKKGKQRGYVERQEVAHDGGLDVNIQWTDYNASKGND